MKERFLCHDNYITITLIIMNMYQKNNNQMLFLSIILHEKYLDSNSNIVINFPSLRNYNT